MAGTILREVAASKWLTLLFTLTLTAGIIRPANAQSDSKSGVRLTLETNSRLGLLTYVPGQWGELHLRLENRGDSPRELLCTSYFDEQPTLQFGRQFWLPARSRLNVTHPVLFPPADRFRDQRAGLRSLLIEASQGNQGNEVLVKSEGEQLIHEQSLLLTPTPRNTAILTGWSPEDIVPQDVSDLIVASRVGQGLNNKTTVVTGQFLPADETSLEYLDHIVLAGSSLVDDFAALAAVRRWLHAGGRLWIMLDRADPIVLERLLGDDFQGTVVDRVGLTSVRIDKPPTLASPDGETGETVEYDEPVELTRIAVSGMKIWNTVDGWPAALTKSFGEGRLLITTLGARGWIAPAPPRSSKDGPRPPGFESAWVPRSPMEDLSAYVLAKREPAVLSQDDFQSFAEEHISYNVPTWSLMVAAMSGFLATLFVLAVWLRRIDGVEHFGWSGSLLAVLFGVALTGIGLASRFRVPGTIASVQLAQALSGTDDVRARGMIAVYRPEGASSPTLAARGGRLWPELTGSEGSTRRMVTTDLETFRWEGLPQSAGLHLYSDSMAATDGDRVEARATVDGQGITGRYTGTPVTGTDALLATRQGRIAVKLAADGTFQARADDVFKADQYLAANLLGDEQDRRRRMLQDLFENRGWKEYLDRPHLLLWSNDWEHGFQFGGDLARQGDTLLAVPLELGRPAAGSEVLIPSPLVSFATRRPPDGSLSAGFWDDQRQEWQERSSPSTTWLSFQVPKNLLPLQAAEARLDLKVSGPMVRLEILGIRNGAPVSLQAVMNPVGSLSFEIAEADVLAISDTGELSLGISAGDPENSTNNAPAGGSSSANYWKIDSLALQVRAKAPERSEED